MVSRRLEGRRAGGEALTKSAGFTPAPNPLNEGLDQHNWPFYPNAIKAALAQK